MRRFRSAMAAAIGFAGSLLAAGGDALPASMAVTGREVARHQWATYERATSSEVWLIADKIGQSKPGKRGKRLKALRGVNPRGANPIPDPPARR